MDCPKCNLRYNASNRKPKISICGHTFCLSCESKLTHCPLCQLSLLGTRSNINHSLMQVIQQKKILKDIDKFIKVCFVGESKVGKTSLINRLKGQEYKENTISTIGYDFAFQDRLVDGMNVRFQLWDSAGQERYRAISPLHYKNSDIVVIVYDVTQDGASNNAFSWYEQATKHCPENVIKIFVGNKIDLLDEMSTKSINPLDEHSWKEIASERIKNYEVSCKSNEGIEQFWEIMEENIYTILQRVNSRQSSMMSQTNTQRPKKKSTTKKKKLYQMKSEQIQQSTCC